MFRKGLLAFALTAAALLCSSASAQVSFVHKVTDGKKFSTEANTQVDQTLSIAGMDVKTASTTQTVVESTTGKRDASGEIRVEQKVKNLQITTSVMGSDYIFDSNNPDNAGTSPLEILRDIHKAAIKNVTTLVFDKDNKVSKVEMKEDILHSLPVPVQDLVRGQLDPEELKKKAAEELAQLPAEPVKQGESWERTEAVDFGGGQTMTFEKKYTYEGTVKKDGKTLDKITAKATKVTYSLQGGGLPLTLKGSDLKIAESEETILFNREAGQTAESKSKMRITGDIDFEANGQQLPSKLDLKITGSSIVK